MRISGILVLLCLALTAPAHAAGRLADVQVYDRNSGVILATYVQNGRYFVAGEPGHEYQIHITNTSGQRLLAVASVDGVNVITGETASPGQSGYVMSSNYNEVLDIAGWRKSMNRIASFYFTRLKNSYAARTGRPGNVGVIGVALFRERQYLPPPTACCWPYGSSSGSSRDSSREEGMAEADRAAPAAKSAAPANEAVGSLAAQAPRRQDFRRKEERIGTGHGRSQESVVTYTEFERASDTPDEVVAIYYDSYRNLVAQGVIPTAYSDNRRRPDPFPSVFTPDP